MKFSTIPCALLAGAALLIITTAVEADVYGVRGRHGTAVVVPRRTTVVVAPPRPPAAVVVAPLPHGYIRVVPTGYTRIVYGGYNCYFVGGVYYRPVFYGGETVYVVVN